MPVVCSRRRRRVDPFAADDLLDVSSFKPAPRGSRPKVDNAATRELAEGLGFRSREPAAAVAPPASAARGTQRRHSTGRNRQLNLKVTDDALARFYPIAEAQEWVLGEAFEHAVAALEAKLAA